MDGMAWPRRESVASVGEDEDEDEGGEAAVAARYDPDLARPRLSLVLRRVQPRQQVGPNCGLAQVKFTKLFKK